jgi:hypothetical protein
MIVAMVAMRMMEMAAHQIVDMITMGNFRVATFWAVDMPLFMTTATVGRRATFRIRRRYFQYALIDVIAVHMVQMAVVQVVRVSVVLNCRMAASGTVLMCVAFNFRAGSHIHIPFDSLWWTQSRQHS